MRVERFVPSASSEYLNEVVRAGAGAGKTYALVQKATEIARAFKAERGRWPKVVATTFTRKATQELRERMMLKAIADAPDVVEFVTSRSHLSVSTIHQTLDSYLKRHGSALSLDPGYRVIGAAEASRIARRCMRDTIFADPKRADWLERFEFDRLAVLARSLDELRSRRPDARRFSTEDFERNAKDEARAVADALEDAAGRVRAEATKDTWLKMAAGFAQASGVLRGERSWTDARPDFEACLSAIRKAPWNAKNPPVEESTDLACRDALDRGKGLLELAFDPGAWLEFDSAFQALEEIAEPFSVAFRAAKFARGELEISDLERLALECARQYPETAHAFSQEWDHWLIDEYQDTSPFQVEILNRLTGDRPVYVVGDPQQSIYLFRGSRSEVFAAKEAEVQAAGGKLGRLARNYRSRPELLEFFNDFFGSFDPPFAPMEPNLAPGETFDPSAIVATLYVAPAFERGEKPEVDPEWTALVRRAQELIARGARPEDVCVLARTNRDLREAAKHLSRAGLATHVHASSGFYDRRETLDALALLKFLVNPHDDATAVELMRSPWARVPDATLAKAAHRRRASNASLWSSLWDSEGPRAEGVEELGHLLELRTQAGLVDTFRTGLVRLGFIDLSHVHDMSGRREANLWKLVAQLSEEEGKPGFNPIAFVKARRQDAKKGGGEEEGDAVAALEPDRINLMTVHASKGLQFRHVILPRMGQPGQSTKSEAFTFDEDEGTWAFRVPLGELREMTGSVCETAWLAKHNAQEELESARILYVALTRAKESVYMSWAAEPKKLSWAAGLRWPRGAEGRDLTSGVHTTDRYSYEIWPSELPEVVAFRAEQDVPPPPRAPFALSVDPSTLGREASVTQLLESADRRAPVPTSVALKSIVHRASAARDGVSMHRLMELLRDPSQERLARLARRWFPGREGDALAAVERVQAMTEPPLLQLIRDGQTEWGFAFRRGNSIVEGQIDLWGRDDVGQLWLIDYKSGSSERKEEAFSQLALYALALRASGELRDSERARLAAIYPFTGEVHLRDEPDAAETAASFGL